jgi:C4-dicarboxylate transporter DctM subunit
VLIVLLFIGTPVPVALGTAGLIGLYSISGDGAFVIAAKVMFDTVNDFIFLAIPLFILMGTILGKGKLGEKLYYLFDVFLRQVPGGVGIATILTCAVLSAMIGTSVAIAAMVGSFAITNLMKYGYKFELSLGICVAGGALGILIPPSVPMIVYSAFTQESTGRLFMAGVIPGILAVIFFALYVAWEYNRQPNKQKIVAATWNERWVAFKEGIWALLIPIGVILPLYTGLATVTEIAALGVLWSFLISIFIYRTIKIRDIIPILWKAINSSVMVLFIICGALLLGNALTQLGLGTSISDFFLVNNFPPMVVGINLYAVDGVAKSLGFPSTLSTVIRGTWPFIVIYLLILIIVALVPALAVWLPTNMMK